MDDLRKAANCVYLATDKSVADDLSEKLKWAANRIDELKDMVRNSNRLWEPHP